MLRSAEAVAATGRTAGTLRINTLSMAAEEDRFDSARPVSTGPYPDVGARQFVIDDGLSDIVAGRFDAGIRVGERLEKDMIASASPRNVKDARRSHRPELS